jgi:hypothetical protein
MHTTMHTIVPRVRRRIGALNKSRLSRLRRTGGA